MIYLLIEEQVMTDKPDTNLPGSKPEAGGVEGEGSYTASRDYQNSVSGFMESSRDDIEGMAKDAEQALQGDERDALLNAEILARAKALY
jgi:hypothetical protein